MAIFVLLLPIYSVSAQLCIDSFKKPLSLEQALSLENLNEAQQQALLYINRIAKRIISTTQLNQRQESIAHLAKSWDRLRQDDRAFTQYIVTHFEQRLKNTLLDMPIVRQRLYGPNEGTLFTVFNFHHQLPFVLLSLSLENISLKEAPL
ncbi:MAG: hypothetical protein MK008_10475 [Bdellovibrionales bacterium]|nr:hypothetical protein [Bdellovibrionales bacterium]